MTNTKQRGNINELQCLTEFIKMGFLCSIPYGENSRYDLLVDTGKEIIKVQCKSARYCDKTKDKFMLSCISVRGTHNKWNVNHYDKTQIDVFATYINKTMYIIPVEESKTTVILHLSKPKNNRSKDIRYAENYTAQKFFENYNLYLDEENNISKSKCFSKNYKCIICGSPVYKDNSMCTACAYKTSRKIERPTREELKNLIRTKSFWQISKDFGVSDTMVHKWCKWYDLPYRKRDIKLISDEDWEKV